jgi:hypothetical protein
LQQIVVLDVGSALILVPPTLLSFRMIFLFLRDQTIALAVELVQSLVPWNALAWKTKQQQKTSTPSQDMASKL